mmetsp:Transcript_2372/g.9320  ORF Transcript_2372/g.9320 Transcript_2372/m.9320 type:complete len:244 (+) Transcript_2372:378-1109(+)
MPEAMLLQPAGRGAEDPGLTARREEGHIPIAAHGGDALDGPRQRPVRGELGLREGPGGVEGLARPSRKGGSSDAVDGVVHRVVDVDEEAASAAQCVLRDPLSALRVCLGSSPGVVVGLLVLLVGPLRPLRRRLRVEVEDRRHLEDDRPAAFWEGNIHAADVDACPRSKLSHEGGQLGARDLKVQTRTSHSGGSAQRVAVCLHTPITVNYLAADVGDAQVAANADALLQQARHLVLGQPHSQHL